MFWFVCLFVTVQVYNDTFLFKQLQRSVRPEKEKCKNNHDSLEDGQRLPSAHCQRR